MPFNNNRFLRHRNVATRAISITSKKKKQNGKLIQLDKLAPLSNPKIQIRRMLGGIGDVIMTTPLCAAIKRLLPHSTLTYVTDTEYAMGSLYEIVDHCPYVDKIISKKDMDKDYADYWVDVTSTGLGREKAKTIPPNRIDMFAEEVGVSVADNPVPIYEIKQEERDKVTPEIEKYLNGLRREDATIIAIQVRSNDPRRTWPLDKGEKLIEKLAENDNFRILVLDWGKTTDRWKASKPNIIPILDRSIADTAALMEQSDVVVCPDSSMLHLAGALGKKIVTIFGPIPPQSRCNHYANATAITMNLPCFPCWYTPLCVRSTGREGPKKFECLTGITVDRVYDTIIKKLKEEEKPANSIIYGKDISSAEQDNIILVKRSTRGIGDILMALNGIEALKLKYPTKKIYLAVQEDLHEILSYNPNIDKLLDVSKAINYKQYFLTIDISSPCARYESDKVARGKPVNKSRVELFSEAIGTRNFIPDLLPKYYISDNEFKDAQKFFKKEIKNNKPVIFFAPSAAEKYRDYPEKHWLPLITELQENYNILINLKNDKNKYGKAINISNMSFRNKMAILGLCDGCIATDSAPLHVAAALKIPCIALFGPIEPGARCRCYHNTTVLKSDLQCVPCWRNGNTKCKQKPNEPAQVHSLCMEKLYPHIIIKIAKRKFKCQSIMK